MWFWVTNISLILIVGLYLITYVIDPTRILYKCVEDTKNQEYIKTISDNYLTTLGIKIDKQIYYRYVKYKPDKKDPDTIVLGTFHEWNNTYYIDISVDIMTLHDELIETVQHETRHMIVQELKNKKIINLTKYTENIAQAKDETYIKLFDSSVKILKEEQKNGKI